MTVTPEDVNEMERIQRILNGEISEKTAPKQKPLPNGEEPVVLSKGPTKHDVAAMEKILQNLNNVETGANNTVKTLMEDSATDKALREALVTTQEEDGPVIGAWQIQKNLREGLTKKEETVYHIKNVNTGEAVKASFLILESAKLIVNMLNQGADLRNPKIREVAEMEIKYRRLRENALEEKLAWHRANKKNDQFKRDLYEAKFDAAKAKALYYKEKIKNLYYKS